MWSGNLLGLHHHVDGMGDHVDGPWIFPGAGVLVVTIARCIALAKHAASNSFD